MNTDADLLQRFTAAGDQAAFGELVRRHIDFVYAAALRHVGGDRHRADDVTQLVFVDFARHAAGLTRHPCVVGWLYAGTRFTALNTIRQEQRRALREREAEIMPETSPTAEPRWEQIRPLIDEAIRLRPALEAFLAQDRSEHFTAREAFAAR